MERGDEEGGGACGERVVTSLIPRLSPLAYTQTVFFI